MKLSAVINTKNAAKTLEAALKSVKFADEIIVVDMKSTDDTVKIAKKYTSSIFSHEDVGYVEPARNFAISKARGDWILILDADEEVPQELKKTIEGILKSDAKGEKTSDCYYIPRKNLIFGKYIQKTGWWPDYVLRLFKKGYVEWSDEIHSIPITRGEVHELSAVEEIAIVHHNYQHIEQYIDRMNKYSTIQAQEVSESKSDDIKPKDIFKKFYGELLSRLFAERGVDDGNHGLSLSLLQSISEASVVMKSWEEKGFTESNESDKNDLLAEISQFRKELSYWIADWHVENSSGLSKLIWQIRRKFYF